VNNIATPEQRAGQIWDTLRAQAKLIAAEPRVPWFGEDTLNAFDITDNGGIINGQYPNTSKPAENFTSLIDNLATTKYYISGRRALWVEYISPRTAILSRYTITSGNDVPDRDPKDWKLLGSNDGTVWAVLDSQLNQQFSGRRLTRTFPLDTNTTAFQYYRLQITANNGHTGTQFSEWELWERRRQAISFGEVPPLTYGDEPFDLIAGSSAGLPVELQVISGPGTFTDSMLALTGAGNIVVRATQAGNEQYFPATADVTIAVNKAEQSISFGEMMPRALQDTVHLPVLSSGGLPLQYSITQGSGYLAGNVLTLTHEGQVTIRASQPGNDNYEAAQPVEQTLLVYGTEHPKKEIKVKVYPNPNNGHFKVKLEGAKEKDYAITVFDMRGYIVSSTVVKKGAKQFEVTLALQHPQPGVYYLHVSDGVEKIVAGVMIY
jgi:hypothetical protein